MKIFTIHFATINTVAKNFEEFEDSIFTIHFATINTPTDTGLKSKSITFTIHFATINTQRFSLYFFLLHYLQYTLLLLILVNLVVF